MHTPDGYAGTKLTGTLLERRLGVAEHDPELEHGHQAARAHRGLIRPGGGDSRGGGGRRLVGRGQGSRHAHLAGPRRRRGAGRAAQRPQPPRGGRRPRGPARRTPGGLVVGLDFSFSFPAWFVRAQSCATVGRALGDGRAEGRGVAGRVRLPVLGAARDAGDPSCRRTSGGPSSRSSVGGISPKSMFQIGGAGAVGTGSVRGMPHLRRLQAAGFSIWPFDPASRHVVLEIYPRLLTGPVRKSSRDERARYVAEASWPVPPAFAASIIGSEDAFDAAISALVMDRPPGRAGRAAAVQPIRSPCWRETCGVLIKSSHERARGERAAGSGVRRR